MRIAEGGRGRGCKRKTRDELTVWTWVWMLAHQQMASLQNSTHAKLEMIPIAFSSCTPPPPYPAPPAPPRDLMTPTPTLHLFPPGTTEGLCVCGRHVTYTISGIPFRGATVDRRRWDNCSPPVCRRADTTSIFQLFIPVNSFSDLLSHFFRRIAV